MKILGLETSARACSAAVTEDGAVLASAFQCTGLTHSRTLMPIVKHLFQNTGIAPQELDAIAVAVGPGSFTGIRIGVSAAKGLAFSLDKPAAAVSTLAAMARNAAFAGGLILCAMDARRGQIYNAVFSAEGGVLTRLTPDRAISLDDLAEERKSFETPQFVVGDGAELCYNDANERSQHVVLAPPHLRFQSAWGVARAALEQARANKLVSGAELTANYLRLSQAERERLAKEKQSEH